MNKKILVIPVLLLTFALLSLPVMGAPATKIEGVTLVAMVSQTPLYQRPVDHTIIHAKGTSTGTVTLNIPGQDPRPGTWNGEWVTRNKGSNYPDPDPEAELIITGKVTLTFTGGTFKGVIQRTITGWTLGPPPGPIASTTFEDHMVFHGTGDFQGWTLKLSYEGPLPPVAEGYVIIPK